MSDREKLKREACLSAVEEIKHGMILGLGSGSTVRFALEEIGNRIASGALRGIRGIPSSGETEKLSLKYGIPLTSFDEQSTIDLDIDGADEVDPHLNLIKGGGGALLREKILAQASRRTVIVVDESKISRSLGEKRPVPVEIIPFSWKAEVAYLESLGSRAVLRQDGPGNPFVTDQGNYIIDCDFKEIRDPAGLARILSQRAAIMEHGLFIGLAAEVIVAGADGIRRMSRGGTSGEA
ncbi:MAG: ribose 5-phosphate isomerase A [Spirochaetes bacterium RBG_16_49_21]|nr:MAG: ribose 5-phosphate isomerase A [Spirochaetes bacterium RBG_16_49_21]